MSHKIAVFGRTPVLPVNIDFGTKVPTAGQDYTDPTEYLNDVGSVSNDVFHHVVEHLQLIKIKSVQQAVQQEVELQRLC